MRGEDSVNDPEPKWVRQAPCPTEYPAIDLIVGSHTHTHTNIVEQLVAMSPTRAATLLACQEDRLSRPAH